MRNIGIGGLIGLIVGIGIAEWLGNENDAAYISVITFGVFIGAIFGKFFSKKT